MGQRLALDGWLNLNERPPGCPRSKQGKDAGSAVCSAHMPADWRSHRRLAVGAQYCRQHQQEAEQHRPRSDPVRMRAQTARRTRTCSSSHLGFAGRGGVALNQNQALPWPDFAHAATIHRSRRHARIGRDPALTGAAHFDPLAHILDVGPPRAGLGSSWHRRVMLTALPATKSAFHATSAKNPYDEPKSLCNDDPEDFSGDDPDDFSGRRSRPRNRRSIRRRDPGRGRPTSVRGREPDLRQSRSEPAPCVPLRWRSPSQA